MEALLLLVTFDSGGEAAATYSSLQDNNDAWAHEDDSIARQRLTTLIVEAELPNIVK